jgi:hypothetical protein
VSVTKKNKSLFTRFFSVIFVVWVLAGIGFASAFLFSCAEEECLVWGENCSQQYLLDNYGTTEIDCCEGWCDTHGGYYLTCGRS